MGLFGNFGVGGQGNGGGFYANLMNNVARNHFAARGLQGYDLNPFDMQRAQQFQSPFGGMAVGAPVPQRIPMPGDARGYAATKMDLPQPLLPAMTRDMIPQLRTQKGGVALMPRSGYGRTLAKAGR